MAENEKNGIYAGIQMIMEEVGAIGKNKRNTMQNFNFRGIDDVMNTLHPLLAKAKIFVVPDVQEIQREERTNSKGTTLIYTLAKVDYYFISTEDGSKICATVYGEGMDSGDKSLNKAMSIAMKYACFQVFCIPTEEMVDPDQESHEVAPRAKRPTPPVYPPEFMAACKVQARGTTLGKLYKEDRNAFTEVTKEAVETRNSEQLAACQTIVRYMEAKNR
jgi:hypothetical protein